MASTEWLAQLATTKEQMAASVDGSPNPAEAAQSLWWSLNEERRRKQELHVRNNQADHLEFLRDSGRLQSIEAIAGPIKPIRVMSEDDIVEDVGAMYIGTDPHSFRDTVFSWGETGDAKPWEAVILRPKQNKDGSWDPTLQIQLTSHEGLTAREESEGHYNYVVVAFSPDNNLSITGRNTTWNARYPSGAVERAMLVEDALTRALKNPAMHVPYKLPPADLDFRLRSGAA